MTSRIVAVPAGVCIAASLLLPFGQVGPLSAQLTVEDWPPASTFSILAYDSVTGEVGGAVQSRVFAIGNRNLWAEADAGVVATQAGVHGHMHGTDLGDGKHQINPFRAVGEPDRDVLARLNSQRHQTTGSLVHPGRRLRETLTHASKHQRLGIGK